MTTYSCHHEDASGKRDCDAAAVLCIHHGGHDACAVDDARAATAIRMYAAIETLRAEEGDSVIILCDNPEGPCAVECSGEWTNWFEERFDGDTTILALENAVAKRARREGAA